MSTTDQWVFHNRCPKCGKPYTYVGDPVGNLDQVICQCRRVIPQVQQFGWVCPICGTVNAPWAWVCAGNHNQYSTTITWKDEWGREK